MASPFQMYKKTSLPQLPRLPFESTPIAQDDIEEKSCFETSPGTTSSCTSSPEDDENKDNARNTGSSLIDSEISSETVVHRSWYTRWFLEWWMMEILSWFFGLVCMVIIVVVLSRYNGKPDPKWKIGLSIGSFISIFSGFAKSALLLPTAEGMFVNTSIDSVSKANVHVSQLWDN